MKIMMNMPILSAKIEGVIGVVTNLLEVTFIKTTPHSNMAEVGAVFLNEGALFLNEGALFLNEGAEAILEAHPNLGVNIEAHPNQKISHKGAEEGVHQEGAPQPAAPIHKMLVLVAAILVTATKRV